jgi:hypothetical protein
VHSGAVYPVSFFPGRFSLALAGECFDKKSVFSAVVASYDNKFVTLYLDKVLLFRHQIGIWKTLIWRLPISALKIIRI